MASIRDRFGGKSGSSARPLKHRQLMVDPLEERTLLSVYAADWDDVLVNQTTGTMQQGTLTAQSIATDHDGDFVVAWTRYDPVYQTDANGDPVLDPITGDPLPFIDPITGEPWQDANIYARYFTDEVQRLTLPDELGVSNDGNTTGGSFSVTWGGNEVQKISISGTYPPSTSWTAGYISGAVTFGFDVNGNGIVSPGETTPAVFFNEATQDFTEIASNFETALQGLGGALSDVEVFGINPHEYYVNFGDLSLGANQPEITVESSNFTTGLYPAVLTSTVREPVEIGPINLSATDPYQTVNRIQQYFLLTSEDFVMGPIEFPPDRGLQELEGPYEYPDVLRTAVPGVTVTPVWELDPSDGSVKPSLTKFDITFDGAVGATEGAAGKRDHPLLVVSQAADETGAVGVDTDGSGVIDPDEEYTALSEVVTLKETSPEFRVNPPEPDDPNTPFPERFNQTRPDVAMDADGEFIITWEGDVPQGVEFGTISDVFARRFRPVGHVDSADVQLHVDMDYDGIEETPIQGVVPLLSDTNNDNVVDDNDWLDVNGDGVIDDTTSLRSAERTPAFRVNTTTTGAQGQPAIGMDDEGYFVIAWGSGTEGLPPFSNIHTGQELGFFNGIRARWFDRDGTGADNQLSDFLVNSEFTSMHTDPYVAMSDRGASVITWTTTDDERYVNDWGYYASVEAKAYESDGTAVRGQWSVASGGGSATAFDDGENFVITTEGSYDGNDNIPPGGASGGVRGIMYDLDILRTSGVAASVIRDTFRVNSAAFDPADTPMWSGSQWNPEPALDADGELVVVYDGAGPDTSENVYGYSGTREGQVYRQTLIDLFYKPENADLLQFFDPMVEYFPLTSASFYDSTGNYISQGSTNEIDKDIENIIIRALKRTDPPATDVQIGRIRALLEEVAGLMHGESNGVMFSRFDADPVLGPQNILHTDCVANNERDGHNSTYILTISTDSTGGTFVLWVESYWDGASPTETVTINPVYTNQRLNVSRTRAEIESKLQGMDTTGAHWTENRGFESVVKVRIVSYGSGFNSSEITARSGTPWDYEYAPQGWSPDALTDLENEAVFEIVFQGEAHDQYIWMGLDSANLQPQGTEAPKVFEWMYGDLGTTQTNASIGMEQDGDYVIAWTQYEEFTQSWTGAGVSNQNIYYRRFTETTDTAGPKVVDLINHDNEGVANGDSISGPVRYVVLSFDEELKVGDSDDPNSMLDPDFFELVRGTTPIPEGVIKVDFGMNKAADLAGTADGFGGSYPTAWTRSNRWEAILVLDANGALMAGGDEGLKTGEYTITAGAELRDKAGNPLGFSGFLPSGRKFSRDFTVTMQDPDVPVNLPVSSPPGGGVPYTYGTTHPETPGAVAVDADGDHVVVWTGNVGGRDRVLMRVFDAYGDPAMLPELDLAGNPTGTYLASPVMWVSPGADFLYDIQRHGNVAIDEDGDFVVTWTNYADGDVSDADVYARRFGLKGLTLDPNTLTYVPVFDSDPFLVNTYTDDPQKWSDVAMDVDGDFVITWSSYGQEAAEGALGTGYGIYARRYDSFGQPLAPEFRVNITAAGNQQGSSVAMSGDGEFVVVWTSDQNGIGDDIIAREFFADGSPKVSPLVGEIVVNNIQAGDQRFPDVSMRLDGENYIVTWTDSAADFYGTSIWAELAQPTPRRYTDSQSYSITATHRFTISVPDAIAISDLNLQLGLLDHARLEDVRMTLESPAGTQVMLFEDLPRPFINGAIPGYGPGYEMYETIFDDQASTQIRITDSDAGAVPPYNGTFVPEQLLNAFNGENAQGTWTLIVEDRQPMNNLTGTLSPSPVPEIGSWSLIVSSPDISADSFLVNTTRQQNQMFSSVSMDNEGGFVITWSGFGDQQHEADKRGHGVFFQQFDELSTRVGLERRANSPVNIEGNQWISSVGTDARGNFVIAWTGDDLTIPPDPLTGLPYTNVYTYVSYGDRAALDDDGPLVTDVLSNGNRVLQDDVLDPDLGDVTELTVVFSEDMSEVMTDGLKDKTNIENLSNWKLLRNGSEVIGGVIGVDFDYNPVTRRHEAVVSLDGNGINVGRPGLYEGDYLLTIKDDMTDVSIYFDPDAEEQVLIANRLDGDADGLPASNPITIGYGGYQHHFTVGSAYGGLEFRINSDDPGTPQNELLYEQRFAAAFGTGLAREESTRSLAVDHDGDFVVVWTSYGETPGEPAKGDVFFRLYDRYDNPITDPATGQPMIQKQVNTYSYGHQRNAAVAMDADGEFVIVWESEGEDPDPEESWGIYGRRYNSAGKPILSDTNGDGEVVLDRDGDGIADPEDDAVDVNGNGVIDLGDPAETAPVFRVNTDFTGHQLNPAVAMNDYGDLVVAWATAGQDFSFNNDVYGQRFNRYGERQGFEFLVNDVNQPGQGNFEVNPAVAMTGPTGAFAVAWDVVTAQQNGVITDSEIRARQFSAGGVPVAGEFRGDTGVGSGAGDIFRVARNPQLAANDAGGYLLVWEAYMGNVIDAYDVYYTTFGGGRPSGSGQINMPGTGGAGDFAFDQVNPSVAVDADGDFAVVWNGQGAQPDPLNPLDPNLFADADNEGIFIRNYDAADEAVTVQSRVNRTGGGIQQFPTLGMEPDGDAIVVWSGRGVGDQHGIFARRYDEPTDTVGPLGTELRLADVARTLVRPDPTKSISGVNQLVVVFDENLWQTGEDDPEYVNESGDFANWRLLRDGVDAKEFGIEIVNVSFGLNLSANKWEAVITFSAALPSGAYVLEARHPVPDNPSTPDVDEGESGLRDARGNPLEATSANPAGDDAQFSFYVRRFGDQQVSASSPSLSGHRLHSESPGAVGVDADGDHVVAWTAYDASLGRDRVYFRLYDADGTAASAATAVTPGGLFPGLDDELSGDQRFATVATDVDGDFVVTWTQYDASNESDIYARRFRANLERFDGDAPFLVNQYTADNQKWSDVAMDADGDFLIAWSSYGQEDDGQFGLGYGVYVRKYNRFGQPEELFAQPFDLYGRPAEGDFLVNFTTGGNQTHPSAAMDTDGGFVVTWVSDQEAPGTNIMVRSFWPDGRPQDILGWPYGEQIVNDENYDGTHSQPDVDMSLGGTGYVVTWVRQDAGGQNVYARQYGRDTDPDAQTLERYVQRAAIPPEGLSIPNPGERRVSMYIPQPGLITDMDVTIDIEHPRVSDLIISLIPPWAVSSADWITLSDRNPKTGTGQPVSPQSAPDYDDTTFDDEAQNPITAGLPPFDSVYAPEQALTQVDNRNLAGLWQLRVYDADGSRVDDDPNDPDNPTYPSSGRIKQWSISAEFQVLPPAAFPVNTNSFGDQVSPSVAVDYAGNFVVAWNGISDPAKPDGVEEDPDGQGVFFRRFDAARNPLGDQMRANRSTTGNQSTPSVGVDGSGNFVVTWMDDAGPSTEIYEVLGTDIVGVDDFTGPIVTGVLGPTGDEVFEGSALVGVKELKVVFSEALSVRDGKSGPDSAMNPDNWLLERNGLQMPGAITDISFDWNGATRKYEAVIAFDGNTANVQPDDPLPDGHYRLVARDSIHDSYRWDPVLDADQYFLGNPLDGDVDGVPGTDVEISAYAGYSIGFHVADTYQFGAERLANQPETIWYQQRFAEGYGTGMGQEQTSRTVAVDRDGDFAVVWTSYGQDGSGAGVYMRMFHFDHDAQTYVPLPERRVNTTTAGDQRNPSVAIDADGDFVVVWEALNRAPDGTVVGDNPDGSWGVYGQRFSSVGEPLGGEFRVNTWTQQDQLNPAVSMDEFGNFIVVWASKGQPYSFFNDVRGQLYNYNGEKLGAEFLVNTMNLAETADIPGSIEVNPTVAMDAYGNFVVAWERIDDQTNGLYSQTDIFARIFGPDGQPADFDGDGTVDIEFQVNIGDASFLHDVPYHEPEDSAGGGTIRRSGRNPQIATDLWGNFIVVWEAFQDNDFAVNTGPESYGVYFRRWTFDPDTQTWAEELLVDHQANLVITSQLDDPIRHNELRNTDHFGSAQVNPSVAMDADGDYKVVWNGNGADPHPADPAVQDVTNADKAGVWIRNFHTMNLPPDGENDPEYTSPQRRVNMTSAGTQQFPSIGMDADGDAVVVWSGAGVGDSSGTFFRWYDDPTDTAGPRVSDLLWITDTGQPRRINIGEQLTQPLGYLVVVFDEQMMANEIPSLVADSVFNPDNYSLLKDGVELVGGISQITNYDFTSTRLEKNPATNKWEAWLKFDPPLEDGHYDLVISNSLRDRVSNPLGRTGFDVDGEDFVSMFDVVVLGGREELVNDPDVNPAPGVEDQYTRPDPGGQEHSPQAIAGDADGEYVVVWTDTTPGEEGVYAKVYNGLRWAKGPGLGQRSSSWDQPPLQIRVTDNPTAMFASVARDADGDFVVTWSQDDDPDPASEDWNVWARRYDATGTAFEDAFPVNSVTDGTQRYSTVAMDVDGDFVITWQSNDGMADFEGRARDGDGYGVYAQRYTPAGEPLGGTNEVQVLTLIGNPVGSFRLEWDGNEDGVLDLTNLITVNGNPFAIADQVETELNALGADVNRVEVQAVSLTELAIHFIEEGASKNQEQIYARNQNFFGQVSEIMPGTLIEGYQGEFLVNDTTVNNQMFPTVAISAEGDFVISWTSAGGYGDASHETNIYAKKFVSNDAYRYSSNTSGARDYAWGGIPQERRDMLAGTSTDDPANHIVDPSAGYDGVVQVWDVAHAGWGTGSLLRTGRHVLTAAHVVDEDDQDGVPTPAASMDVEFHMPYGTVTMTVTNIYIHPGWDDLPEHANDLAILVLPEEAPAGAERYDIYRSTSELGPVAEYVGYGTAGQGMEQFVDNNKRLVKNEFEVYGEAFDGMSWIDFGYPGTITGVPTGTLLAYDFDNGLTDNDMFGSLFGIHDLGLGDEEGSIAHGDSGGPAFINGQIAGVASFIIDYSGTDIDGIPSNASFGSAGFHVRTSAYADWIDMMTQSTSAEFLVNDVPVDPATLLPMATGDQKWSSVALDADGDFVISWTSYGQDGSPNPYIPGSYLGEEAVLAKRFNADTSWIQANEFDPQTRTFVPKVHPDTGQPMGEFLVNTSTDGKQQHSQVAMDADGDFVIVWESSSDRPGLQADPSPNFGVFAQRYAANDRVGAAFLGPNGELGGELAVNATMAGNQRFPSVTMDDTGDTVIAWAGEGQPPFADRADTQGIYHQRFASLEDDAGPTVADVINVIYSSGKVILQQVPNGVALDSSPKQFLVSFSEDIIAASASAINSITNLDNWVLTKDGDVLRRGVYSIDFGLNQSSAGAVPILPGPSNKYEAVITLDGDPSQGSDQPLGPGEYVLTIRSYVEDQFDNRLDGDYDGVPDGDFRRTFLVTGAAGGPIDDDLRIGDPDPDYEDRLVNYDSLDNQDSPAVASDAEGNHVVVWVDHRDELDALGNLLGQSNILAQRFDSNGVPVGGEIVVNSYRAGNQLEPDVAMDAYGNFVVVWSGEGEVDAQGTLDQIGIFGRVFDAFGQPLDEQFAINQSGPARRYSQRAPSVAMDAAGDFAVSWTSYGQDNDLDGVFARLYNFLGEAKDGEFQVNSVWQSYQDYSDVAMDADGNFVVVWSANQHPGDGSEWCISSQRYRADGMPLGGETVVNTYTLDDQIYPAVAMDADGNYVVTWASDMTDGGDWGVYARRYSPAGGALDGSEFRVNQTTLYSQYQPDVSMDAVGNFVITWTTLGQDNLDGNDRGIFARAYNAGVPIGEFQVNATVVGDQWDSAVAMDADGDFAVVWVGADNDGTLPDLDFNGVYHRYIRINPVSGGGTTGGSGGGVYYAGSGGSSSTVLALDGTAGNDVFELIAGPTASSSVVLVNGVAQVVGAGTTSIRFDGQGGKDQVVFTGSVSSETVELWPDHGTFTADRYTVSVFNVESIDAYGGGGNDVAMLRDDPSGVNYARLEPGYGRLSGDGFDNEVSGFRYVHAYGSDGADDVALLYDDPHTADTLEVTPDVAIFSGSGFFSRAVGFRYVHGYATEDSGDVAILRDNPEGKDAFQAWPDQSKLYGSEFYARVRSFAEVRAYATEGSGDVALLYDDAEGKDTFRATPDQADFYGEGFRNRAHSFDSVRAYASEGNGDVALLYGDPNQADTLIASPDQATSYGAGFHNQANSFDFVHGYAAKGNGDVAMLYGAPGQADTLEARPDQTVFSGAGFYNRAKSFDYVHGYATEGDGDAALLYDDAEGADTFEAWPQVARFVGEGFYNRVKSFDYVHAYATEGNGDVALLRDDPNAADTFEAWPDVARLVGEGFFNRALSFDYVHAYATEGGKDVALLHDNPDTADAFDAWPDMARLYGSGFYNRVKSFDYVHAYATPGGKDVAKLYDDPETADTFEAWPEMARLHGSEFYNRALSFRYVLAYATQGGNDVAKLYDSEGKDTLVASPELAKLYNGNFFNQARNFRNTYSHSTAGGYDTAYLYDSALEEYPDRFETGADWVRLSNELLGYAHWLREFEEVTVTLSNDSDIREVDPEALDFILHDEG